MSNYETQSVPEQCYGCTAPRDDLKEYDAKTVTREQLEHSRGLRSENLSRSKRILNMIIDMGLAKDSDIARLEHVDQLQAQVVEEAARDLADFDERRELFVNTFGAAIDSQIQDCPGRAYGQDDCNRPKSGHRASELILTQISDIQLCRAYKT